MFQFAKTIIRSPLQNVQNMAKYSAIIFTIWEPTCVTTIIKMSKLLYKTIEKLSRLVVSVDGGCEVQVFKL
jgi:hypothetical protein